jgi:CRP/FNR family cyclic AMP-dependent transcriptional regulator
MPQTNNLWSDHKKTTAAFISYKRRLHYYSNLVHFPILSVAPQATFVVNFERANVLEEEGVAMIVLDIERLFDVHFNSIDTTVNTAVIDVPSKPARSIQTRCSSELVGDPAMRDFVTRHPLLGALPERERLTLLQWSRVCHASRYETIYREGEPASSVLIVLQGHAKSSRATADGREVFLSLVGPLECAGAIASLYRRPHEADLTALSVCRLLAIDARQFRKVFERESEGLLALVRLIGGQLQRVEEQLTDQYTLTAAGRLAKALLDLAELSPPGSNGRLTLHLSQQELGILTNCTRESVNKQLKGLFAAGGVSMSDGKVTAICADRLCDFVFNATRNFRDSAHQRKTRSIR